MSIPVAAIGVAASLVFVIPALEAKIESGAEARDGIALVVETNRIEANQRIDRMDAEVTRELKSVGKGLDELRSVTTRIATILEQRDLSYQRGHGGHPAK